MSRDRRRQYGSGSVYQQHARDCPPPVDGKRPEHRCTGPWRGVIQVGWTTRGTRRTVTVSAGSEAEVKRKLDRKRRDLEAGVLDVGANSRATVHTWSETWLTAHKRKARPSYYATDASAVRKWIVPTIGHKRLDDLVPGDVRAVTNAVRDAGRSTTTAAYVQGVLERMLRAAIVEGHGVPQRLLMLDSPGKAAHDRDAMDPAHARAILDAAAADGSLARWSAALIQGMRQGECLGLTWDAIDLDGGVVDVSWQLQRLPYNVPHDRSSGFRVPDDHEARQLHDATHLVRPKTSAGQRLIPLLPWMAAALVDWRTRAPQSPHGLVWPAAKGKSQTSTADREAWYALQDASGVRHPSGRHYLLHEGRHTTATLLLQAGVDPAIIQAILGHSSILTTRGYQHVRQELARKALGDAVAGLAWEVPQIGP